MAQYANSRFALSFAALSDATRRGIIDELGPGSSSRKSSDASVSASSAIAASLRRRHESRRTHRKLSEARFDASDEITSEMKQEQGDGQPS
ncbi:hypothetical protein [Sphingomonas qomolangmaensis]|uniref:Uncharacterized protein n=1 Tax=Sphingomonas qomolangmaensis TaxID=2918765 RepID=A0ABY5LDW1_9SPHN|nr:hypothetical protein [Sphingomonas qomolangmaensis]UUL84030.1 hypothetical protein NMP03_07535 [Sphingomonas qomolangmaensis]